MIMENNLSTFSKISTKMDYEGRWVLISNNEVIASGTAKDIKEEMKHFRKNHPSNIPLIAKIPKKIMQIV